MLGLGIIVVLSFLLLQSCQVEDFNPALTKEFSIQSNTNGATYQIKVGLPEDYFSGNEKYATLYVLDGEENFGFVANNCKEISSNVATQNVIVVSIGYGQDRSIDYTPTKVSSMTGGGAQFLDFIESQLIPRIENEF